MLKLHYFLSSFQLVICISKQQLTQSKVLSALWNLKTFIAFSVHVSAMALGSCDKHFAMQRTMIERVHGSLSAKQCSRSVLLTGSISSRAVFGVMYGALVCMIIFFSGRVPSLMAARRPAPCFSEKESYVTRFVFTTFGTKVDLGRSPTSGPTHFNMELILRF